MNSVPTNGAAPAAETQKKLSLVAAELPLSLLLALDAGTVDELARQYAKKGQKIKESRDDYKVATKAAAKVYCALETRLNAMKAQNFQPANKSLAEFIKDITGEKPPTHPLTLKNAVGAYVKTGLIEERDYDCNSNNCLEIAARIVDAVKGNLQHDAVLKAAAELKERSDKEASHLRELLASVKPAEKLTAEEALELFEDICADGHLAVCFAQLPDLMKEMPEKEQRENYIAYARSLERVDVALGEKVDAWTREASSVITIAAAGKPVGQVKPEIVENPSPKTEPEAVAA